MYWVYCFVLFLNIFPGIIKCWIYLPPFITKIRGLGANGSIYGNAIFFGILFKFILTRIIIEGFLFSKWEAWGLNIMEAVQNVGIDKQYVGFIGILRTGVAVNCWNNRVSAGGFGFGWGLKCKGDFTFLAARALLQWSLAISGLGILWDHRLKHRQPIRDIINNFIIKLIERTAQYLVRAGGGNYTQKSRNNKQPRLCI